MPIKLHARHAQVDISAQPPILRQQRYVQLARTLWGCNLPARLAQPDRIARPFTVVLWHVGRALGVLRVPPSVPIVQQGTIALQPRKCYARLDSGPVHRVQCVSPVVQAMYVRSVQLPILLHSPRFVLLVAGAMALNATIVPMVSTALSLQL